MACNLQLIPLVVLVLLQQAPLTMTTGIKDIPTPLPIVARTRPANGHVFDRPAIIAIVHITTKAQVEDTDMEGHSLPGAERKAPFWTYVEATLDYLVRVNERRNTDPGLAEPYLRIEQMDLAERPVRFEFAREYIVFLENAGTEIRRAKTGDQEGHNRRSGEQENAHDLFVS